MNPFQPLYDQCNTKHDLPDFPRMLDIELTSSCNFRCKMCPTGNLSLGRKPEFMSRKTWAAIYSQAGRHGTALRFIGWGEPTLHPELLGMVSAANLVGCLTHINTNGSKIDREMAKYLVFVGLSSIKFSFQGIDRKSYEEMRGTDFFDGMIESICVMLEARGDRKFPYIAASTTTTYETPEQIEEFRAMMEPLVDQLTVGKTIFDYMDMSAVRLKPEDRAMLERLKSLGQGDRNHPDPCPEVFDKLSIHADGSVVVCCNDYNGDVELGNVNDTPISEMWRHPKIETYRERLSRGDYNAPLCKDCYNYMGVENEKAVAGRDGIAHPQGGEEPRPAENP